MSGQDGPYAVLVTLTAAETPTGADPQRRVGPFYNRAQAEHAIAWWKYRVIAGDAPPGTTFAIVPHADNVPHRDSLPPLNVVELAGQVAAEPADVGFPNLYDRLCAVRDPRTAHTAWHAAKAYLNHLTIEAEVEEQRIGPHRARVAQAVRGRHCLYTAPALDLAARLLADLVAAGNRHGVTALDWEVSLAGACVDAIDGVYRKTRPQNLGDALPLLDVLVERLNEIGQPCTRKPDHIGVVLPLLATTPGAGGPLFPNPDGRHPLVVTLSATSGWDLTAQTGGMSPAVKFEAPYTVEGAQAVADVAAAVNRGELGHPLRQT